MLPNEIIYKIINYTDNFVLIKAILGFKEYKKRVQCKLQQLTYDLYFVEPTVPPTDDKFILIGKSKDINTLRYISDCLLQPVSLICLNTYNLATYYNGRCDNFLLPLHVKCDHNKSDYDHDWVGAWECWEHNLDSSTFYRISLSHQCHDEINRSKVGIECVPDEYRDISPAILERNNVMVIHKTDA